MARAIFACQTPVVSAVGHEHDVTISDLVADVRAATPSQAGELVVPVREELLVGLEREQRLLARGLRVRLDRAWQHLEAWAERPVLRAPGRWLDARRRQVEQLKERLRARSPLAVLRRQAERLGELDARLLPPLRRRLERARERAQGAGVALEREARRRVERAQDALGRAAQRLEALSPEAVLQRGFSITLRSDGSVLRRAGEAQVGERVYTRLAEGAVESVVQRVVPGAENSQA